MGLKPVFHNERRVWIWTIILLAGDTDGCPLAWPGLATFLWYKPPPTDHWRAFNKTQSSNGQNRRFLPTIRQWQLYFIWSINLSHSYLQFRVSNCQDHPAPVQGGIVTNLNPRAQSLMGRFAWPDLQNLNSSLSEIVSHVSSLGGINHGRLVPGPRPHYRSLMVTW